MKRRYKSLTLTLQPLRSLRYAAWTIIFLIMWIVSFIVAMGKPATDKPYIPAVALAIIALPGMIVHLSYWRIERRRQISFTRGSMRVEYPTGESAVITSADICEVRHYTTTASGRAPWHDYEYLELELYTGERYMITCLLADIDTVTRYLKLDRQQWRECRRFLPILTIRQ